MTLDDIRRIDWDGFGSTAEWTRLLDDLLGLAAAATADGRRAELADALDAYADHSTSDDLDVITRLDRVARKAARSLRSDDIAASIGELQGASTEFTAIATEFGITAAGLHEQASALRGARVAAALASLTDTITSLQSLAGTADIAGREVLDAAIADAVASAQTLRELLDKPRH